MFPCEDCLIRNQLMKILLKILYSAFLLAIFSIHSERISYCQNSIKITTAKIGYIPIVDHLLLGVAAHLDSKKFEKVKIDALRFSEMGLISEGLRSGDLDGGFLLAPLAYQSSLNGAKIKIVLLGHRNGSAFVVTTKKEIKSPSELIGKTIAIPHRFSTHNMLLHIFSSKSNLVPNKDFSTIELTPPEMPAALANGSIDGYIVAEPIAARSEVMRIGKVFALSKDIWKDHPDCVLVFREDFIAKYPEAIQELVSSIVSSGVYAEQHREEAAQIGATFLGQPLEALRISLNNPKDRVTYLNLTPNEEELSKIQSYMGDSMNLFPKRVNIPELLDLRFANKASQ